MDEKDIENGTTGHPVDEKPPEVEMGSPLKSEQENIQYGRVNEKDSLLDDVEIGKCFQIRQCLRSLTIEPIMFLFCFGFVMNLSCLSNMMMDKGCLYHFNYSQSICNNLSGHPSEKDDVEILANNYSMYFNLMDLIEAVMMIFIAPWSDKYGRKLPLFLVLTGAILTDIGLSLCAFYFESELFFLVLAKFPAEIFGGYIGVMAIIDSHASEVSSKKTRTMKYTFLEISLTLGLGLGGLCGGFVYRYYGYFYIYAIAFVLHVMCLPWLLLVVKETAGLDSTATWKEKMRDFFVCESLLKGFKALFRARENKGRALLLTLFASMCVLVLTFESITGIGYVYVHHIYDWDPTTYNTVSTVFNLTSMVVLGITILLLVRILKVSDFALGIIGVLSMMLKYTFIAFAHFGVYVYYIGNALGYLIGLITLSVKSTVSKIADKDEVGKVFSFLATCEAIVPMLGKVALTKIFNATLDTRPSVGYLTAVGLIFIPLGSFLWAFFCLRKDYQKQAADTTTH